MIIVSQCKKAIVNFENIEFIYVKEEPNQYAFSIRVKFVRDEAILGFYATEERAKEILQEIIKKYSAYLSITGGPALTQGGMDVQPNVFNIPKVYMMPEN